MTIAHRAFSAAFGTSHATRLPKARPAQLKVEPSESRQYGVGSFTSSPWEGLYLHDDGTNEPALDESTQTSTELERFLSSLMYGE